ncbi:MAG: hypothetical protein PVG51_09485 [Desulfosarcina sp.]|jgi:hypothetical protein
MIDRLQQIATAIAFVRLPALAAGLVGLAALILIILIPGLQPGQRWTIPSIVILIWGMSAYAFVVTFLGVPEKPGNDLGLLAKLKYKIIRCWYGIVGVVFLGASMAIVLMTMRMVLIWLRGHGG